MQKTSIIIFNMLVRCFQYILADGKVADYFATEEAIIALTATKLSDMYIEVEKAELDKFERIAIKDLLSKVKRD